MAVRKYAEGGRKVKVDCGEGSEGKRRGELARVRTFR